MKYVKIAIIILLCAVTAFGCWFYLPAFIPEKYTEDFAAARAGSTEIYLNEDYENICDTTEYLTGDGEYDYYSCVSETEKEYEFDERYSDRYYDFSASYILKYKGDELIKKTELPQVPGKNEKAYKAVTASVKNGYLYYIIQYDDGDTTGSVYRTDLNFKKTEVYVKESRFGKISPTTLNFDGDDLIYITDKLTIIRFDGREEREAAALPPITEQKYYFDEYYDEKKLNYTVCVHGETVYCAFEDNLYKLQDGRLKKVFLPVTPGFDFSFWYLYNIRHIEFCADNPEYLRIYLDVDASNGEPPYTTFEERAMFVFNTKTLRKIAHYKNWPA